MNIEQLSALAQGGVTLTFNEHQSLGMSVQRYLTHKGVQVLGGAKLPMQKIEAMIQFNQVVHVQVQYRNMFLLAVYGADLETALYELAQLIESMNAKLGNG